MLVVVVEDKLVGVVESGIPSHKGKRMEEWLDDREHRAIHVIDGGGEAEQATREPAQAGCAGGLFRERVCGHGVLPAVFTRQ